MTPPRSEYTTVVRMYGHRTFLIMEDTGKGPVSLTTEIAEAVSHEIKQLGRVPSGIVYRDQANRWDGWDPRSRSFVLLRWPNPLSADDAIAQYIRMTSHTPRKKKKHKS